MSNHFHLVARSAQPGGISRFLQGLAGQYAQQLHARLSRRGRFWQDRFYSCVLDRSHLATALRYVELNPVRARLVAKAEDYPWSSAAFHSGADGAPEWLDSTTFGDMYSPAEWRSRLAEGQSREERAAIRRATQWETALGDGDFLERLEAEYQVKLQAGPVGRPPKKPQGKQSFPEESMVVGGQGARGLGLGVLPGIA